MRRGLHRGVGMGRRVGGERCPVRPVRHSLQVVGGRLAPRFAGVRVLLLEVYLFGVVFHYHRVLFWY